MSTEVDLAATGRWTEITETDKDGQPELDDEGKPITEFHMIKTTSLTDGGLYEVETFCGITAPWNQTMVDHPPAGPGTGHEDCVSAFEAQTAKDAKAAEKEAKAAAADEPQGNATKEEPGNKATAKSK
jgi:hypothetical protein